MPSVGTSRTSRSRNPPPRQFELYNLTRDTSPTAGLTDLPASAFTQLNGAADGTGFNIGQGFSNRSTSNLTNIGFDFNFDNIVYKNFVASSSGWLALVDPTVSSFTLATIIGGQQWQNATINATFTANTALLAPWFDDLRNICNETAQLALSPFSYSAAKISHINQGLETPPTLFNPTQYAVSYCQDVRSHKGRRLVVRWNSITFGLSTLRFEAVVYENGAIEYRYASRNDLLLQSSLSEGAAIGIWMPNGTNRFRDFAIGLGWRDEARQENTHGGFVYTAAYSDTSAAGEEQSGTAPYTINLKPSIHWPGTSIGGSVLSFAPPTNRRTVLPRKKQRNADSKISFPLQARTGDSRRGNFLAPYDDRRALPFGQKTSVNYPSTLIRGAGGATAGTAERQDLFAGDFAVNSSIVKSSADSFIGDLPQDRIEAYSEAHRPEQDPGALNNPFFVSGSNLALVGAGLQQSARAKTQIRFTLPVNFSQALPQCTSSIYYYNNRLKAWEVPANTMYVMANGASTPPGAGQPGGDWANPNAVPLSTNVNVITEDARGFGPIGNVVSSGSHTVVGQGDQSDVSINKIYTQTAFSQAIGKSYAKSIRNNDEYRPTPDETFTLPINQPFLIERAVFEIPLSAGPGWFIDQTQCFIPVPTTSNFSFDFAGPALTVALMRHIKLSENGGTPTQRDIILTGTITHSFDNTNQTVLSNSPSVDTSYQLRPVGYLGYGSTPGSVVTPASLVASSATFTGSVSLDCEAQSSTGVVIRYERAWDGRAQPVSLTYITASIIQLLQSPTVVLKTGGHNVNNTYSDQVSVNIQSISPMGRSGAGFTPAGRAIFGNDVATLFNQASNGLIAPNPFYISGTIPAQFTAAFNTDSHILATTAVAAISLITNAPSPYLVMPGDQLTLSVSKMRPFVFQSSNPVFSGSNTGHDISLLAGNISVTLYGSLIQAGVEYHDNLNQPLSSNAIHEVVGEDQPVVDQYEVAYRTEYTGSFTDNVMLGQLLQAKNIGGKLTLVQGTRDRKFNKLSADPGSVSPLTTNVADIVINPYKNYRLQTAGASWGYVRPSVFFDSAERFYDSMMPNISSVFSADNTSIFIQTPSLENWARRDQVDVGAGTPTTMPIGWIFFDFPYDIYEQAQASGGILNWQNVSNKRWTKAFPFEPRYASANRQLTVNQNLVANYQYLPSSAGGSPYTVLNPIPSTAVGGLFCGSTGYGTNINILNSNQFNYFQSFTNLWFADVILAATNSFGYYTTGSTVNDDLARVLYGFGDVNTYFFNSDFLGTSYMGTGHLADHRDVEGPHPVSGAVNFPHGQGVSSYFEYSPVIRGWKYGVFSGIPSFSKAYWRHGKFGQLRDMLEQRLDTKFYQSPENKPDDPNFIQGTGTSAVRVRYVDKTGKLTKVENTFSVNQSFECTSSIPYFDGVLAAAPPFNPKVLNLHVLPVKSDLRRNIRL